MENKCPKCGGPLNESGKCSVCVGITRVEDGGVSKESTVRKEHIRNTNDLKIRKRKRIFITQMITSGLCLIVALAVLLTSLVFFGIAKIPPINRLLENANMIEEGISDAVLAPNDDDKTQYLTGFSCNQVDILVGQSSSVVFSVMVEDGLKVKTSSLSVYDGSSKSIAKMHDDGQNGDAVAGDDIYSAKVDLKSDKVKTVNYYASDKKHKSNGVMVSFYESISPESFTQMQTLTQQLTGLSFDDALEIIKNSPDVESFETDEANGTIKYKTKQGFTGVHEDPEKKKTGFKGNGANAFPKDNAIDASDYSRASGVISSMTFDNIDSLDPDVAVIRPFRYSEFKYDDFKYAGQVIAEATKGNVDVFDETSANMNVFKSLHNYGTVLIDAHGTLINNTTPYILTGEMFDGTVDYSADYHGGRIVVLSNGRIAVSGEFFNKYYANGSLESSFWYLGSCYSFADESIARVLVSKGAGAVVGFTDPVTVSYCNRVLFELAVNSMILSTDTLSNSIECAKAYYGAFDPQSKDCRLVYLGNDSYTYFEVQEPVPSNEREIVLVLDRSGSMLGQPIEKTKRAATRFVKSIFWEEASVGIVSYEANAQIESPLVDGEYSLFTAINGIVPNGGTNIEAGLKTAYEMLSGSSAKQKIIVLMSDGLPNNGLIGQQLCNYADTIKNDNVTLYTLGFFEALENDNQRYDAQTLLSNISTRGCHYEVKDSSDLLYFFDDIASQIKGQKYYYIRIESPVDITVEHGGEVLSSDPASYNTRTSFGSVSFEMSNDPSYDKVKVVRLKEGADYRIKLTGTASGTLDYSISFMDENGQYIDHRELNNVTISNQTTVNTVAARVNRVSFNIDNDGDGNTETVYRAPQNSVAQQVDNTGKLSALFSTGGLSVLVIIIILILNIADYKRQKEKAKRKIEL